MKGYCQMENSGFYSFLICLVPTNLRSIRMGMYWAKKEKYFLLNILKSKALPKNWQYLTFGIHQDDTLRSFEGSSDLDDDIDSEDDDDDFSPPEGGGGAGASGGVASGTLSSLMIQSYHCVYFCLCHNCITRIMKSRVKGPFPVLALYG